MAYRVELVIVSEPERIPAGSLPENVKIAFVPYFEESKDLVTFLKRAGLFASYLGLWRETERSLFVQTSLSSKLSTYATAGVPVLVDAPEGSAAWKLIDQYRAGFAMDADDPFALGHWFGDVDGWNGRALRSLALAQEHFDVERNVNALQNLWAGSYDRSGYSA